MYALYSIIVSLNISSLSTLSEQFLLILFMIDVGRFCSKQNPSSECILETLEITMSSNSTEFDSRFFTQIDGATIGSPDSGSVTDIFGAIHIDKVIQDHCPIEPEDYRGYRDDTFDVCLKSSEEDQKLVTNWMNENIYQDKIKFTANYDREKMVFLDTEVTLCEATVNNERGFYLIPQMYSKDRHASIPPPFIMPLTSHSQKPSNVNHK